MKIFFWILFPLLSICCAFSSEVRINVDAEFKQLAVSAEESEEKIDEIVYFIIDIVNNNQYDIFVKEFDGTILGCGVELWLSDLGVRIWPREEVEVSYSANNMFPLAWTRKTIKAGETKRIKLRLLDLVPKIPLNEDLVRKIKSLPFQAYGSVILTYYVKDEKNSYQEKQAEGKFDLGELRKKKEEGNE